MCYPSYLLPLSSLALANASGKQPKARILKRSSVPRRQTRSRDSSQVGSTRYIVSCHLRFAGICAHRYSTLAASDWPLFTLPTPAKSAEDGPSNDSANATSPAPESSAPSDQSGGTAEVTPTQPGHSSGQPSSTAGRRNTKILRSSKALPHPKDSNPLVTPTTFVAPSSGPSPHIPGSAPSPPQADEPRVVLTQPPSQPSTPPLNSLENPEVAARTDTSPLPELLAGVTNEPVWMKRKGTLNYFRITFKLGCFPDIIQRWYEFEQLLGFQDVVSVLSNSSYCALMLFRPQPNSRRINVHRLSVYSTATCTTIGRTTESRSTLSLVRSWSGGPSSVLLVGPRLFGLVGQQGSIPSLSSYRGGVRS